MSDVADQESRLGTYLKDRRSRLDPAAFGFSQVRRRTPGLRREEVAQRANISPTWYTWLEQGRGGAPSPEVLDRIASALMLTDVEREHLFLIGLGRPPEVRRQVAELVTPRLQRLLDLVNPAAAMIRTATWDLAAWNRAAVVLFKDYSALPLEERNVLWQFFCNSDTRSAHEDWQAAARFIVGAFRADVTRAGLESEVADLVSRLCRLSPAFEAIWRDNEVSGFGGGLKRLLHPRLGWIEIEYSTFSVDGRSDLSMVVYNPLHNSDRERVRALLPSPAGGMTN